MYDIFIKPSLDKLFAVIILGFASPLLLLVCVLLAVANHGKVWFIQPRPGKDQKVFNIVKFRTMNLARDAHGELLPDDLRLTSIGRWIRMMSLDEFPQLVNVLKGEMSLVGPRPLLVEYLPLYNARQQRRHEVRPGITGWAQVNGRNEVSWPERFELDVWYVDNLSIWVDLKIILMTIVRVLRAEGISSGTTATMEPFRGNY